jgi:hypothetical protein
MCIAIFKPENQTITRRALERSFRMNPHGAGFCYSQNNQLHIRKGFFNFGSFLAAFESVQNLPVLIHFRWATHGALNKFNCHPWQIDENHAMIHNGVIEGFGALSNGRSDTGDFTEFILKPLMQSAPDVWNKPPFISLMSRALNGNKVLIMDNTGEVAIYGEDLGFWDDGCWYSNQDYLKPKRKKK